MPLFIVLLPLLVFCITAVIAVYNHKKGNDVFLNFLAWFISTVGIAITSFLSLLLLLSILRSENPSVSVLLFNWFTSGNILISFTIYFDNFVCFMVFLVSFISFLVHFYSYFYVAKEDNLARFQSYLTLFTFSMILLVTSSNLVQMFVGWELISLCSYLLIVFWYNRDSSNQAGSKAFLLNRFADIGFLLGIFATFSLFGSVNFADIASSINNVSLFTFDFLDFEFSTVNLIGFLFLIAAFAKSAQLGLHVWLPDAMEAPTPVSALLHAATMVTAGVFLLIKLSPIYQVSLFNTNLILIVSGLSTLFAAIMASVQNDIKKIIAYSTMSQLGYMFLAIGVNAYPASFFHLFTHAFFKSLLFLGAGAVIHSMSGEQNIKKMGNLWRKIPVTYLCMLIGVMALVGIPGFSGFYSKDAILEALSKSSSQSAFFAYILALITVFFTAFYSLRLMISVFHSKENYDTSYVHVHENAKGMLFVLVILAIFSVIVGKFLLTQFLGEGAFILWQTFPFGAQLKYDGALHVDEEIKYICLSLIGMACIFSYIIYVREKGFSERLKSTFPIIYKTLVNKLYFDEIYHRLVTKTLINISKIANKFDDYILDKYLVNAFAGNIFRFSRLISKFQTGLVSLYAVIMALGACLILTYYFFI